MPDGYRDDNGFSWPEDLQRDPDEPPGISPALRRWFIAGLVVVGIVGWWLG